MGLGKTYSADYLIDSNGNTGVSGQVLISTATGIDWADGAAITGGPFLPLAGGRITGTNKIEFNNGTQFIQASDGVDLKLGASDDIILETNYVRYQAGSEYARISGSANSWIASPSTSKLGVGTTSPQKKLDVYLGTDSAVASVAGTISAGEYAGLHFGYSEAGNSNYRHSAIVFERDDASHGDARGKIHILNSASGSASADLGDSKLTILPSGNVGIGETDPKAKLNITGVSGGPTVPVASSSDGIVRIESSNGGVGLDIGAQGASPYSMWMQVGNTSNSSGDTYPILLNPLGGNVGVGTTSPTTKLYVDGGESTFNRGNSAGAIARFRGSNAEKAVIGTVDSWFASNVGIGTTSPGRPLTVNSDSAHKAIRILENDSGNESWDIGVDVDGHLNFFNSADTSPSVTFLDNGNVGIGTNPVQTLEIHDSDASGYTHFGIKGTGHKYVIGVGNDSVADVNDKLYFYDNDNSAFRLALDTSGNVGIGTTSPGAKLDIHTATNTNGLLIREDSDDSITHNFYIDSSDNGVGVLYANGQSAKIQLNTAGNSYFDGGNVGIGTTSPSEKLHLSESTSNSYATFRLQGSNRGGIIDMYQGAYPVSRYLTDQSGNISIYTSGAFGSTTLTEKVSITTAGNVGIGTTSPSYPLEVKSASPFVTANSTGTGGSGFAMLVNAGSNGVGVVSTDDGGSLTFDNGATGAAQSEKMRINALGNVGIGTNNPSRKLHVSAGNGDIAAKFENTSSNGTVLHLQTTGDNKSMYFQTDHIYVNSGSMHFGNNTGDLYLKPGSSNGVGIGTTSPGAKLDVSGNIRTSTYYNFNGNPSIPTTAGAAIFDQSGVGPTINGLNVTFRTGNTPAERMRITSGGNVGIGTASPESYRLDVAGTSRSDLHIFRSNQSAPTADAFIFRPADNTVALGTANAERVRIDSSGNVGIGTTSPGYKLEVYGSTRVNNTLWVNNSNGTAVINAYSGGQIGTYLAKSSSATANFTTTGVSYPRGLGFGAIIGQGNTTDIPVNNASWNGGYGGNIGFWSDVHYGAEGGTNSIGFNAVIKGSGNSNSYGFFSDLSGATDGNRYGIYTKGEQQNYFSGNVGIGTASPTHKLHVNGNMRLTGALRDSNNATGSAGQVLSSTGSATDWISLPASSTVYTPKVYNLNNSNNINSQGQKLVPDFGTLEIEGNTTVEQVSGSDTDFQVSGEGAGIYEVTYAVFYKNTSNQRTPLGTYLTLNGTAVNGSLMVNYLRADVTGGGNWSSCTNTFYVNVTDASHPMALCVRRADSSTAPSGISMVEPAGMAVKSTISFRRIS